jgi:hypothetical protein
MLRITYVLIALGLAVFYYYFIGAGPSPSEMFDDLEWWRSRGWLLRSDAMIGLAEMADSEGPGRLVPVFLFLIPPVAIFIGALVIFKSAVMRAFLFWLSMMLCIVAYYGTSAERVWRFFEWRFVAVAASLAAVVTIILYGPSLLRALGKIPRVIAGVLLLALFAGVFMLQTEITGTDSDMRFNITPWPVVTVFGMLIIGYSLAALHIAAGAGLWVSTRSAGIGGIAAGAAVSAALAVACSFLVFSDPPVGRVLTFALIALAYMLIARQLATGERAAPEASGLARVATGLIVVLIVGTTNWAAKSYQISARNETAQVVLLALEAYKKDNGEYPERLKHLVPDYVEEVPRPQIGLILDEDDEFEYSNFGDSYALEFASVQWVQCAYSPPYEFASYDDDEEEEEEEDTFYDTDANGEAWEQHDVAAGGEEESEADRELTARLREAGLEGSWNCAEEPPKVW